METRTKYVEGGGSAMKPISKWFRSFGANDAFEEYYGRLVRKGGVGLPSAKEAKRDLEQARHMVDPRFPL